MAFVPVSGLEVDLPECDDETARAEAARANQRLDDLVIADPVEPEVTQAELDALAALVDANKAKASADIVALSDLVNTLDAADRAEDNALEAADKVEDDQQTASLVDLANRIGSGGGGSAPNPDNDILLDSLAGSTDDAKLDAAWTIAAASNPKRAIRLSARNHTFTKPRVPFSGLRILGPNTGWQNPEIAGTSGALPQCNVTLNITGSGFWLVANATTYDVTVAGICFKSGNVSSFYQHSYNAGTCYAGTFDTLAFYGFKYVFGTPNDAFSMTLCTFKGSWSCVAVQDTQFSLRGSDNFLWCAGDINYGWAGANGGKYLVRFENLSKTPVKHMYLTARGGSRAILVQGPTSQQGGLDISDCVIEGQNLNDPAMGALIVVEGGGVSFTNTKLNFGMARPTDFTDRQDTALVMVRGGICLLTNTWTGKANTPGTSTPASAPMLEVSGGVAHVQRAFGVQPLGTPVQVRRTGGTLVADSTVTVL